MQNSIIKFKQKWLDKELIILAAKKKKAACLVGQSWEMAKFHLQDITRIFFFYFNKIDSMFSK